MLGAFFTPFSLGFLADELQLSYMTHEVKLLTVNVYNDQFIVKRTNLNVQKIIVTKINKGIITNDINK